MDDVDRAKIDEQEHRNRSIKNSLNQPFPKQKIIDGVVLCIDCLETIPEERLKAQKDAARCVECKSIYEKKQMRANA